MTPANAFLLLMLVLYLYAVAAAIDFGSGAILLWAVVKGRLDIFQTVERYASPVWEVVNVFFILFAVGLVGFFPGAIPLAGTVMLVPGAVGLGAIAVRSLAFVLRAYNPHHFPRLFPWLLGVTGILAPLPFVSLFAFLQGYGFTMRGAGTGAHVTVHLASLLLNPITLAFMAVAIAAEFALGALFLSFYARASGLRRASESLRRIGQPWLVAMVLMLLLALGVLMDLSRTAMGLSWLLFFVGVVGLSAGLWLAGRDAPGPALLTVLLGTLAGLMGMAVWQLPWMIVDQVPIGAVFTNPAMASALTVVLGIGIVIVVPSLVFLGRMVLRDAYRVLPRA